MPSPPSTSSYCLNRPADAPQLSKEAGEKLQEEHMANIPQAERRTFKLVVAEADSWMTQCRSIFVFQADLGCTSFRNGPAAIPAIKAGRLSAEVHGPWLIEPDTTIHGPAEPPEPSSTRSF